MARIKAIEEPGYGGALIFETNNGSGSGDTTTVEAMRIDEFGNIGINNASPSYNLDIDGIMRLGNVDLIGSHGKLIFAKRSSTGSVRQAIVGYTDNYEFAIADGLDTNNGQIKISYPAPSNTIYCHGNGNVGIGNQTNPGYKLDVNGSFNCTSLNVGGLPFSGSGLWSTSSPSTNTANIFYNDSSSLSGTPYSQGSIVTITGSITDSRLGSGFKPGLIVEHSNRTQGVAIGYNGVMQCGSNGDAHLHLRSKGTGGKVFIGNNVALPLTVTESRVGINNSNPSYPLDITGDIRFTGNLYQGSSLFQTYTDTDFDTRYNTRKTEGLQITGSANNINTIVSANIGTYASSYSYIDLRSSANSGGWIDFGSTAGEDFKVRIRGHNEPKKIEFYTSANANMILDASGDLLVTGNITAYYSDERLKKVTENVENVLNTLKNIDVFKYKTNELANSLGINNNKNEIGLSAQQINKYYPEVVSIAPFDRKYDEKNNELLSKSGENYLTLNYERLVPILLQGIKELNDKNIKLENELSEIKQDIADIKKYIKK